MTEDAWAAMFEQEEIDAFIREYEEARDSGLLVDDAEVELEEQLAASRQALAEVVSAGIPGFGQRDDERSWTPDPMQTYFANPGGVRWYA